jgi:hypothetical protein
LCVHFPETALAFLDTIVGIVAEWAPRELMSCLSQIQVAEPSLAQDSRFRRLSDYGRQHNLSS